ncbi:MAG: carboxymuconolactone decarboxylase family protein [Kordiimonas sp.]
MTDTRMIDYPNRIADVYGAWADIETVLAGKGIERGLNHLVKLLASQINNCAFCVKMHTSEARRDGETNERLDRLVVWRHVNDFTMAEKAAFAWAEALTVLSDDTDFGLLRAELRQHYSDEQIAVLTSLVSMINLWNRLGVSNH